MTKSVSQSVYLQQAVMKSICFRINHEAINFYMLGSYIANVFHRYNYFDGQDFV